MELLKATEVTKIPTELNKHLHESYVVSFRKLEFMAGLTFRNLLHQRPMHKVRNTKPGPLSYRKKYNCLKNQPLPYFLHADRFVFRGSQRMPLNTMFIYRLYIFYSSKNMNVQHVNKDLYDRTKKD